MIQVSKVLAVLLILMLASVAFAGMTPEKAEMYRTLESALSAQENGQQLTAEQQRVLDHLGPLNDRAGELDNFGGPDDFGYSFICSEEDGGPTYEWVDISETGTEVLGWSDDVTWGPFDIGFDFPFYGETYNQVWLCSNGWMSFNEYGQWDYWYWWNDPIPFFDDSPNNAIYWCWQDLYPDTDWAGDAAYYGDDGNGNAVFQFEWSAGTSVQAEVILYPDGTILMQYGPGHTNAIGWNGTRVALENADGTVGIMASDAMVPEGWPHAELAVLWELLDMGVIAGTITDLNTGNPIENAEVGIYRGGNLFRSLVTDENGEYSVMVEVGDYEVMAGAFTYFDSDLVPCTVELDQTVTVDIALEQAPAPEISADPEALFFTTPWMGTDSDVLTISNIGGSDLDFDIDIEYVDEEIMAGFVERNRLRQIRADYNHPVHGNTIYAGPSSDDLGAFPVVPTQARFSELDDPYFILFQDQTPWNNSHQEFLAQMEIPFDVVGSAMFADQDLDDYTVVMLPSTQGQTYYNNFANNHERFEDWVNDGGWLEFHGCTQGATWTLWDGTQYVHESDRNNTVVEPEHPLVAGIPENFTGSAANHGWLNNVPEEALVIITDTSNRPVLIETRSGRGNMVITSETWEYGVGAGQVAGDVMHNAILYCAEAVGGGWLFLEPDEGVVAPNGEMELVATADAAMGALGPGTYEAIITVSANFPNVETVTVWATLTVLDPGTIAGQVYDSETLEGIEGAMVYRWVGGEIVEEIECDIEGNYSFPVGEGMHILTADATDYYANAEVEVDVIEGEVTQQNFALVREVPPTITFPQDVIDNGIFFDIQWGAIGEDVLPISNDGGLPLNWEADITLIEDEEVAAFRLDRRIRREAMADPEAVIARRRANLPQLTAPNWNLQEATPGVVIDHNYTPAFELDEGPYLLMGSTQYTQSLMAALDNLEIEYTYIQSDNYATVDLTEYGTLISGHDGGWPNDADAQAAVDFMAQGGTFMYFGGVSTIYNALMNNNVIGLAGNGWQTSPAPHINIVDPGSDLATDVEDGYTFTNNSASYTYFRYSDEEADVAVQNGNGQDILLAKEYEDGMFIAFANSPYSWYWENPADQAVLTTIVGNMINYTGSGWLTMEPMEGTVEVDETFDINMFVDAVPDSLPAGVYEAMIEFSSDHWAVDPVEVWVTMQVNGGPPSHQFIGSEDEPLQTGYFELISFWLDPVRFGNDAMDVFGDYPGLVITYQNNGEIFVPGLTNTIEAIDVLQGYQIFLEDAIVDDEEWVHIFHIQGDPLDPMTTEYSVNAGMWNWVGYPFNYEMPVEVALGSIADDLLLIINDEGELWIPELINTMGMMTPGEGYMVITDTDLTFTYDVPVMATNLTTNLWTIPEVEEAPAATGLPYPVMVTLSEAVEAYQPATIEIYDGNLLVGKAVVQDDHDFTPVIAWQGSEAHSVAGFQAGNDMSIVVKSASGSVIPTVINEAIPAFGEGAYASVTVGGNAVPTEFTVSHGYPNPFNPSVTVPFALPMAGEVNFTVFNILGQEVLSSAKNYEVGHHRFMFNAGNDLVSGVYFLQVEFNNQINTQKLMLLK